MIIGRDIDRILEITDEPVLDTGRFAEMAALMPQGDFYTSGGIPVPRRVGQYHFKFTAADAPNREFGVVVNGVPTRIILTDGTGVVEFPDVLHSGPTAGDGITTIRIEDKIVTGRALLAYLTVTNYGLIQAAIAAIIDEVDADIDGVKDDTFLDSVSVDDIEQKFGLRIATQKTAVWSLDVYREILNDLFQAYDIFSGTARGLRQVVGAITQVPPTTWDRDWFGPRWVLGWQYLRNNEFKYDTDMDGSPDDWLVEAGSATILVESMGAGLTNLFADQRLEVTATGVGDAAVHSDALPQYTRYLGYTFTFSAWVESTGVFNIVVGISDDGGATWTESAPIATGTSPAFTSIDKAIPITATGLRVRVRQVGSGAGNVWSIERTALFIRSVTGLYLGDGTIPRSLRESSISRLLRWWCSDSLTAEEMSIDGLSLFTDIVQSIARPVGHVNNIVPAHVGVKDRDVTLQSTTFLGTPGIKISYLYPGQALGNAELDWDIGLSELKWHEAGEAGWGTSVAIPDSGLYVLKAVSGRDSVVVAVNYDLLSVAVSATEAVWVETTLKGVVYAADWLAGTKVGLGIMVRVPDRFTHLSPTVPSIYTETLVFDPTTSIAPLSYETTADQTKAILLEDGIAVPNTDWSFPDDLHIQIATLIPTATYVFSYEVLMEFESDVIDLGASWQSFVWYFDSYTYERFEKNTALVTEIQQLNFNRDTMLATLRFRSDLDQTNAILTQTLGGTQTTVSASLWSCIDALTVSIAATQFNPNATYVLTYTAKKTRPVKVPTVVYQVADSAAGVVFGAYITKQPEDLIDQTTRYHKIKVNVYGVLDVRDVRIGSLVLKGLTLDNDEPGV